MTNNTNTINEISIHKFFSKDVLKCIHVESINQRIKVYNMPLSSSSNMIINKFKLLGKVLECSKIMFYVKNKDIGFFNQKQFIKEGHIKGYFNGEDANIYVMFLDASRNQQINPQKSKEVLQAVNACEPLKEKILLPDGYRIRWATEKDAPSMANLYSKVFKTYPTNIKDPNFIKQMMHSNVYFTVIEHNHKIVSACSADLTPFNSAELTDCATLPEYRGKKLISCQFSKLISYMKQMNVQCIFSFSRAVSFGMNIINKKHGFTFGGCAVQNSNISGQIEDMNIWYRQLNI